MYDALWILNNIDYVTKTINMKLLETSKFRHALSQASKCQLSINRHLVIYLIVFLPISRAFSTVYHADRALKNIGSRIYERGEDVRIEKTSTYYKVRFIIMASYSPYDSGKIDSCLYKLTGNTKKMMDGKTYIEVQVYTGLCKAYVPSGLAYIVDGIDTEQNELVIVPGLGKPGEFIFNIDLATRIPRVSLLRQAFNLKYYTGSTWKNYYVDKHGKDWMAPALLAFTPVIAIDEFNDVTISGSQYDDNGKTFTRVEKFVYIGDGITINGEHCWKEECVSGFKSGEWLLIDRVKKEHRFFIGQTAPNGDIDYGIIYDVKEDPCLMP